MEGTFKMLISIFRAAFLYLLVILVMRIMGKREIGQLQPYELAITLIISELVTLPMENNGIPLIAGVVPVITITLTQLLLSYLTTKSQWLQDVISGRYTIMIENGKLRKVLPGKFSQILMHFIRLISPIFVSILFTQSILNGKYDINKLK